MPVVAGLAAGICFVILFSAFFAQPFATPIFQSDHPTRPGRIADVAVKLAMENSTLQSLFKGRDIVVTSVRDWGVSTVGGDCPISWCAIILFHDRSDDAGEGFASAIVNVRSGKVIGISLFQNVLTSKAADIQEVEYFLSKYPDAEVKVQRSVGISQGKVDHDPTKVTVMYVVAGPVEEDGFRVTRELVLAVTYDDVLGKHIGSMELLCFGKETPQVYAGDMISNIDSAPCLQE